MASQKESFSAGEASRLTGVPYRTLDHWARTKFIIPSVSEATGTGSDRQYAFNDLVSLRVAHELRQAGISTQALRLVVDYLKKHKGLTNPLAEARLVVVGSDVKLWSKCEELTSLLKQPGQAAFAFLLDIGRTAQEIRKDVQAIRAA